MLNYPKYKYHKDLIEGKIVANAKEELALGDEWVDNPADVDKVKVKVNKSKK